ncbi:MAG: FtsX-like permease family protein, partial [Chloroflexota bacterium]
QLQFNRSSTYASISGIDANQIETLPIEFAEGGSRLNDGQIVVGANIGETFFDEQIGRSTDPIDLYGKTLQLVLTKQNSDGSFTERRERLRVVGVLEESGGQYDWGIYMTLREVRSYNEWATGRRFDIRRDGYERVLIQAERSDLVEGIEQVISAEGYQTFSLQQILSQMRVVFGGIQVAFGCIGSIALLVAAIGIANTMIMAIYERTREIGLMKAVGATNRDVMLIFLGEAGTIGLIGGIFGILLALVVGQVGGAVAVNYMQSALNAPDDIVSPVNTPMWLILFSLVFSTVIGIISGVYPAIRAVQLDPMIALKYE